MLMGSVAPVIAPSAYAEPETNPATRVANDNESPISDIELPEPENPENPETPENPEEPADPGQGDGSITIKFDSNEESSKYSCSKQLSPVGWLVCPIMEVTSKAVSSLYDVIEDLLVVQPLSFSGNSSVYRIWSYCLSITNIVFIVFFLVVIFSQLTGFGISNYGIKRVLPKLIVAALLVNLSFHICAIAVDISNIIGASLRGFFESIPTQIGDIAISTNITAHDFFDTVLTGGGIVLGAGALFFEPAALFMVIPAILGGLVAVVSGLITIAIRQAVVILLVMISPLALVCYMLPNTEHLFKKWKDLLVKMLVFYPLFSLLFGASNLAGWAIIISALYNSNMFMVILGLAVQVFPLFACWSLMKMSGTFLSSINSGLRNLAAGPLATNRAWAESRKQHSMAKHLASDKSYIPSVHLRKYLSDRKIARELETKDYNETIAARGGAYYANSMYKKGGKVLNRKGAEAFERQTRRMKYQLDSLRHANNFEEGIGILSTAKTAARYSKLDDDAISASDNLAMETARAELIELDNARSRHERFDNAIKAHTNTIAAKEGYLPEALTGTYDNNERAAGRYQQMLQAMQHQKDKGYATQYIAANAATVFAAQENILKGKFEKYFEVVPPTNYVTKRVEELAKSADSSRNIDAIIGGMRIFNNRGDTSLIEKTINELCADGKMQLGTHASQALAGFLMFEVKDRDSTLRRFGKYINLETAKMYNDLEPDENGEIPEEKRRHKLSVDLKEYVNGEYIDQYIDKDGQPRINLHKKSKKGMEQLLLGTSFSGAEREAFMVLEDTIKQACVINPEADKKDQKIDVAKFIEKSKNVFNAILPNIVSDQFSYLSGSEQITALAKFITKNPIEELQLASDPDAKKEQQDLLAKYQRNRVDGFINAQVYSQISRAKSDIFGEVKDYYDNLAAIELGIYNQAFEAEPREGEDALLSEEKWREKTIDSEEWRKAVRSGKLERFQQYKDVIRERSSDMFRKNLQKGVEDSLFLNARRGNLPDAKTGLTEYLDLNNIEKQTEVYNRTHPNKKGKKNNSRDDEDDDDAPTGPDDFEPNTSNVELDMLIDAIDRLKRDYTNAPDTRETRQSCYSRLSQLVDGYNGIPSDERYRITHQEIDPSMQSVSEMIDKAKDNLTD